MTALSPLRTGRITASRVAAILGISPYATPDDVLREMVRGAHGAEPEFTGNRLTEYGNQHEQDGIEAWQARYGEHLDAIGDEQEFLIHPEHDWLGATPDGRTAGLVVEVKAPLYGTYSHWRDVPWYETQIRASIDCAQADAGDLVVWRPGGAVISRIERDPWWLDAQMDDLLAFRARYQQTVADPELYEPLLKPLVDLRTDADWSEAAIRYREAVASVRVNEREAEQARAALLALTDEPAKGAGVSVSRSTRKGSVDYKAAIGALAPDAELDGYRKASAEVWTVRLTA